MSLSLEKDDVSLGLSYRNIVESFQLQRDLIGNLLPVSSSAVDASVSSEYVFSIFKSNLKLYSSKAVIEAAAADADDFVLPPELSNQVAEVIAAGSIANWVSQQHSELMINGLNADRFDDCFANIDPAELPVHDMNLARKLCTVGSSYCVTEPFHLNAIPPKMRPQCAARRNTYLKAAAKLCAERKGLLLDLRQMPPNFLVDFGLDIKAHPHHTAKYAADGSLKPAGRFLVDCNENPLAATSSEEEVLDSFLHSAKNKSLSVATYGRYSQRQLKDHFQDLYDYCHKHNYPLSEMRGIVEDNEGAFTRMRVDPTSCRLLCMQVDKNFLFVPTSNGFGVTSTPSIWDYVAILVDYLIRLFLCGVLLRWVDDRLVSTHMSNVDHDRKVLITQNTRVYGPNPFDPLKSQVGAVVHAIGWTIKYIPGTFCPNEKGRVKLLIVFMSLDIRNGASWSLKLCQKVASIADRFSFGIVGMRPFVSCFHQLTIGSPLPHSKRNPKALQKFAVMLWRCVVLTLMISPGALDVPIFSVVKQRSPVHYSVESDAYNKLGVIVRCNGVLLHVTSFPLPFDAPESDYQNVKEFLGLLCGLIILKTYVKAPRGTILRWTSDSMSALSWVERTRWSSRFSHQAYAAYSWFMIYCGYIVDETLHKAGKSEFMQELDDLSRLDVLSRYDASSIVDLSTFPEALELFELCDPKLMLGPTSSFLSYLKLFTEVSRIVRAIATSDIPSSSSSVCV